MRTRARLALALALPLLLARASEDALGQTTATPPCSRGERAALAELGCEVRAAVGGSSRGAIVIGLAANPPTSPPLAQGLAVELAANVALALGAGASAWPIAEDPARLARFKDAARPLVVLRPGLEEDRLAVTVEAPGARFVVRRRVDAEVRRFLPPVPLLLREFKRLGSADADLVALACGDQADGGPPTLAAVGRTFVTLGSFSLVKYEPGARREQRELSPVAAVPLREPLAAAWFTPSGALEFGLSDRENATRWRSARDAVDLTARLVWPGGGCANIEHLLVGPRAVPCTKDERARLEPALREPLDAIAGAVVIARGGGARLVRAGRRAEDGSVTVTDGAHEVRLEHAGAQLALGDLDGDGAPELVTSLDTADPRADAVVVYTWLGAALTERFRVAVPAGVHALALCPARPERMAPIAVAAAGGLWVIQ